MWRAMFSIWLFASLFDMMFLARAIRRAEKEASERTERALEAMFGKYEDDLPVKLKMPWYSFTPYALISVLPFINMAYMYTFIKNASVIEGIFVGAFAKKAQDCLTIAVMKVLGTEEEEIEE